MKMMGKNLEIKCPIQIGDSVRIKSTISKPLGLEDFFLGSVCTVMNVYCGWQRFNVQVKHPNGTESIFSEDELDRRYYKLDLRYY